MVGAVRRSNVSGAVPGGGTKGATARSSGPNGCIARSALTQATAVSPSRAAIVAMTPRVSTGAGQGEVRLRATARATRTSSAPGRRPETAADTGCVHGVVGGLEVDRQRQRPQLGQKGHEARDQQGTHEPSWSWPKQQAGDDHEGSHGPAERQYPVLAASADIEAHLVILITIQRPERRPARWLSPRGAQLPVGVKGAEGQPDRRAR